MMQLILFGSCLQIYFHDIPDEIIDKLVKNKKILLFCAFIVSMLPDKLTVTYSSFLLIAYSDRGRRCAVCGRCTNNRTPFDTTLH